MHILIVDDEPAVTDFLVETIGRDFPSAWIESAIRGSEAESIAARMDELDLLLTDVMLGETDGFALREALLPKFPEMQTVFVTGHDLTQFGDTVNGKKILRKPLYQKEIVAAVSHCEASLLARPVHANAEATAVDHGPTANVSPHEPGNAWDSGLIEAPRTEDEAAGSGKPATLLDKQGFTGKLDQFQLVDIIQLCCLSGRTGRLTISKGLNSGVLFFSRNNIVHAACGEMQGEEAAFRIVSWESGSFNFAEGLVSEKQTIHRSWENLMMESAVEGDETGAGDGVVKKETGLPGQTLGAYRLVRKLGSGDWGDTYEAQITGSGERVSLKVLSPKKSIDPMHVQGFIADANTKSNVIYPHMVSIPHGVAECEGVYFYPRDFVEGESLDDYRIKGKSVTEEQAICILKTVAETILHLGQRRIPHASLKPSSIYITSHGSVRLANIATFENAGDGGAQADIRELSRVVSVALKGGVNNSQPLRHLLTKMLLQSSAGVPSWGALLKATRTLATSEVSPAVEVPNAAAISEAATPGPVAKGKPKPLILFGSIAAVLVLAAVLLLLFYSSVLN